MVTLRYVIEVVEHSLLVQVTVEILVLLGLLRLCLGRLRACIRIIREILRILHDISIDAIKNRQELERRKKALREGEEEVVVDEMKEKDKMVFLRMSSVIGLAVAQTIGSMFVKSSKRGERKLLSPLGQGGKKEQEEGEGGRA